MVPVRGFSNILRVDKSVVLCISIRVEESPIGRYFCFLLFTSLPLGARNPMCAVRGYDPVY
jgi:hypothetical protein